MRTAVSTAAILVALTAVAVLLLGEAPHRLDGERPEDFAQLYIVSWNLRHHETVYSEIRTPPDLESRLGWSYRSDYSFANPPALVPFLYPLSFLPYALAWCCLLLLSLLALPAAVVIAARTMGFALLPSLTLGVLLLCTPPGLVLLILNHVESVIVLLAVLGWLALRQGRLRTGGGLWGLCAALKLFPALWILGLLHRRYRSAAWSALVVGLSATALGVLVIGPAQLGVFLTHVLPQSARWRVGYGNFSLLALGGWAGHPALGWLLAALTALVIVPALIRRPRSPDGIWVTAVAASLLMSPLTWGYYFVFAAPSLAVLAAHLNLSRARVRSLFYALVASLLVWPSLLGGWSEGWLQRAPELLQIGLTFVPTAGLVALLAVGLWHLDGPATPAPETPVTKPVA